MRLPSLLLALTLLPGCGLLYKVDVPQGNLLDQEDIADVEVGMSKRQVSLLLGTPAIASPFHQSRWDYLYAVSRAGGTPEVRNLTLLFEGDSLVSFDGDLLPETTSEADLLEDVSQYERYGPTLDDNRDRSGRPQDEDEDADDR
ncbi:MAG: outer membrane protein assembly factor BamE [Xanthomonadales bacterium]|nr:outer membrane protein assembly factor BamE [Xanthomonadales bacterium]